MVTVAVDSKLGSTLTTMLFRLPSRARRDWTIGDAGVSDGPGGGAPPGHLAALDRPAPQERQKEKS